MVGMQAAALRPVAAFGGRAQEEHGAGDFFQNVGKIFCAHHGGCHLVPAFGAEFRLHGGAAEGDGTGIAKGDGEAFLEADVC